MSEMLLIGRYVLLESVRRRTFAVVSLLTVLLMVLYTWGAWVAFKTAGEEIAVRGIRIDAGSFVGNQIAGVSLFGVLFLGAVLAVLLSQSAIRGDAETGMLQPIVARPVGRSMYLFMRWAVVSLVCTAYVVGSYAYITIATGIVGDWWPANPWAAIVYVVLAVWVVSAIANAVSVFLPMTSTGIGVFLVIGAGLAAGMLLDIAETTDNETLERASNAVTWALPFEPLYKAGVAHLPTETDGLLAQVATVGPFSGGRKAGSGLLIYSVGYVAVLLAAAAAAFSRRDL